MNQSRALHGMPADVVENPVWSHDGALHVRYRELDAPRFGDELHNETPAGATPRQRVKSRAQLGAGSAGTTVACQQSRKLSARQSRLAPGLAPCPVVPRHPKAADR